MSLIVRFKNQKKESFFVTRIASNLSLFWQLPAQDKMKYFEVEPEIEKLKYIESRDDRKEKLDELLRFLGSNPVQKIDKAFKEKYKQGIIKFLDLNND